MANPIHINTVLEIELLNGMIAHVNSVQELRTLDIGDEKVKKVSLVQITKQELDVNEVLSYDKTDHGATHQAPLTLQ